MKTTLTTSRTLCLVLMIALLTVVLTGGVGFAGSCNADVKSSWVYTSPLTGKKYKIDTKIDKETGIKTTTATELKKVTNKSWELTSPRVQLTYDITGDEGKNVVRIDDVGIGQERIPHDYEKEAAEIQAEMDRAAKEELQKNPLMGTSQDPNMQDPASNISTLNNDHENTYGAREDDDDDSAKNEAFAISSPKTATISVEDIDGTKDKPASKEARQAYQNYLAIKAPNLAPLNEKQYTDIYDSMRNK